MRSRVKRTPRSTTYRFKATDLAIALAAFATPGLAMAQSSSSTNTELTDVVVTEDPLTAILNESTGSSIGFTKPLLETPRTVSFVSSEQIALLGISSVDDLTRVVPGTFTTTRYGLQGGINVRGVAADMYFRGMKRINMQGHARTSLASMDSIEVIKGPPSPIYGMGKIGGYSNLTPKSGRAKVGGYLDDVKGFAQVIGGDYRKSEVSAGAGGPVNVLGKTGGYYGYALLENSESYVKKVGAQQRILQGSMSLDNFVGPFRFESGTQAQNSITSGAYMNRTTQALVDDGKYVSGQPLVNLDVNGDGAVGFRETHLASPLKGNVGSNNRPLFQRFNWPKDPVTGKYYPIDQFPKIAGIPQTMLDYLNANPSKDPTGALRAQGAGGPLPTSGQLPVGFVLDPTTVDVVDVDLRRNGAYERVQDAELAVWYADFVYDSDPDFTVKSQFFKDYLNSFKNSYLPYGEKQDIHVWEEKITVTRRIPDEILPEWLRVNSLASINYRETNGEIFSSGGDFDYRQDVMFRNGDHYPNTIFWNQLDNDTYQTGAPKTVDRESTFNEMGFGAMLDIDLFKDTNVVLGARIDGSEAKATDFRRFNENSSNATVEKYLDPITEKGWDKGVSWSASISQKLPWGLRPYATLAKSSVSLDGANNIMLVNTVTAPGGHIGSAELKEGGLKGAWLNDKLTFTGAYFVQTRTDISSAADPTAGAEVSSTETKGTETELRWTPMRELSIQAYAIWMKAKYIVDAPVTTMELDARTLGFQDVYADDGSLLYPAEAFLYGGRWNITIPTELLPQYRDKVGTPEQQYGINANYTMKNGVGFLLGGTYFSSTYADRLKTLELPAAFNLNAGVTYDKGNWHLRVNGYNVLDEVTFRARNTDTGTNLLSVMPGARYEVTAKLDF
jgi:iron complex outermembrane receptor protein